MTVIMGRVRHMDSCSIHNFYFKKLWQTAGGNQDRKVTVQIAHTAWPFIQAVEDIATNTLPIDFIMCHQKHMKMHETLISM